MARARQATSPGLRSQSEARVRRRLRAGAAVAFVYALLVLFVTVRSADFGFTLLFGGDIMHVDAGGAAREAGLRRGDRIVAVDGVATPTTWAREDALRSLVPGRRVSLTVERATAGGAAERLTLRYRTGRSLPWGSAAGLALACSLLALALLADRGGAHAAPRDFYRSALVYVIFMTGTFSWDVARLQPVLAVPWLYSLTLAAPVTCHFMLQFPAGPSRLPRWLLAFLYVPPIALATLLAAEFILFQMRIFGDTAESVGRLGAGLTITLSALYLSYGAIARVVRMRRKRDEIDPVAARWLKVGAVFLSVPLVAGAVWAAIDVASLIGFGFPPLVATAMIGGSVTVVLAITRTRFGELDRVLRSGTGYLLATACAAALYLVVIALPGGVAAASLGGSFSTALAATLIAAIVFGPVRARFQRVVDERFARDRSRARHLLREAAQFAAATLDESLLEKAVVHRVREALRSEGVAFYVLHNATWTARQSSGETGLPSELPSRDPLGMRLDLAARESQVRDIDGRVVAAPIVVDERPSAALVVAPPESRGLDDEDCELLATLAAGLSVAFANARAHGELKELSERLKTEVEIAEKRRREIVRLKERIEEEKQVIEAELKRRGGRAPLIGEGLRPTFELAQRVARSEATALISGETGVGKELVARAIHAGSARKNGPFVVVDCGAIPGTLFESTLFGHERGAFTGAVRASLGAFRTGHGGTVFLDEIGELPLDLQPKLLRVLQAKEIRPVGSDKTAPIDVRVVAGTNRDLAAEVAAGRFREDLLYRLRVIEIAVPPLRNRKKDIVELAECFLAAIAEQKGGAPRHLSADAVEALLSHDWPGNVRELEHAMESASLTCDGEEIGARDLPIHDDLFRRRAERAVSQTGSDRAGGGLRETLESLERERLVQALKEHAGNRTAAAKALGLSRGALLRRLARYGVAS
jgi:transcriptional regulator with GAF, ATPase, and Fis domain